MGRSAYPEEFQKRLAEDYAAGASLEAVAEQYGCSAWVVRRSAQRCGVALRRRGRSFREFPAETATEIIKSYEAGESQHALAARHGTHQTVIGRLLRTAGITTRASEYMRGERHSSWRGGRVVDGWGYVLVREGADEFPEMRDANGYVREHRLVMARHLGRALTRGETVHHKNGDRADNRLKNLELRVGRHGKGATHAHCLTCNCFPTKEEE